MNFYLKNTIFLTLSITTLILMSGANVAYGSGYDGIDDEGLINSTDEFDEFFSFFDRHDHSSSLSPIEHVL